MQKQGCPLSPTITNLVVDPIVRSVRVLAVLLGYVDDFNLVAHIYADFRRAATKLAQLLYMAKFDRGIDAVGKSKTAVMTNCPDLSSFELTVSDPTTYELGRPETVTYKIPILKGEETYKYLGVLMNVNLTWMAQQTAVMSKLQYHMQLLRRKCFPATQTVRIVNQVIISYITAKLAVTNVTKETLETWDKTLASLINNSFSF